MLELQPDLIINYDENNEEFSVETGGYPDNKFELAAVKGKTIYPTPWVSIYIYIYSIHLTNVIQ